MNSSEINALWEEMERQGGAATLERLATAGALPPPALLLRGICHLDEGAWRDAREDFDGVLAAQPENNTARLHRALTHFLLGQPRDAARDFRAGPLFPEPRFLRRFLRTFWPVRFEHPEMARAAQPADVALPAPLSESVAGKNAKALARNLNRHGVKAYVAKRRAEAAMAFEQAAQLDPSDPEHAMFHAWCLLQQGEGERARAIVEPLMERALTDYLEERPSGGVAHPHLVCEYAWALHECREHREALALLSTVRPAGPDDYWSHIIAALCWTMLEHEKNADACFDAAFGGFFLETWDQFVEPFLENVIAWLEGPAPAGECT